MKKVLFLLFAILLIVVHTVCVYAFNNGDIVNMTVYTDIVAKINTQDIASYNIDGYTVVVAESLSEYGFNVTWNQDERALYITKGAGKPAVTSTYTAPKIPVSEVGKKASDVLYSDIKTYMDDQLVTSYNIGGQTVVYFEDLSRYGNVTYDDSIRTLSADFSWLKGPAVWYSKSMYRVGTDIPAGDYYVVSTSSDASGYYCKYTDSTQDDIEDNDGFNYFTFFRCYDGQYLKLSRCKITSIENAPAYHTSDGTYGTGTYRVGIDMPAGEYKFTVIDPKSNGYYCVYTDITYDDIENNDIFEDVAYYTVQNGQYLQMNKNTIAVRIGDAPGTPSADSSSSGEIKMYDKFPEVPDFGAFANISPVNTGTTSTNIFTYRTSDAVASKGRDVLTEYSALLLSLGYKSPLIGSNNICWTCEHPDTGIKVAVWLPMEGYDRFDIQIIMPND